MGNSIFPTLPGLGFSVTKKPQFITKIQKSVNGRELRAKYSTSPLWNYSLSFEFLRDTVWQSELDSLAGFFLQRFGSWDSFLFQDPDDYIASGSQFGVGDGATTSFQLTRSFGGFSEPIYNVASLVDLTASMWTTGAAYFWPRKKSTPKMWSYTPPPYTISSTGMITFSYPPTAGQPLYWNGTFYYRARFLHDDQEYEKFMYQLWTNKKCELLASLGNKI